MLFECACVALIVCVITCVSVAGNKLCWWQSWLMCAAGSFTFVILLGIATTLPTVVAGVLMAGFSALLRWLGMATT